jgi:hypothetical protein
MSPTNTSGHEVLCHMARVLPTRVGTKSYMQYPMTQWYMDGCTFQALADYTRITHGKLFNGVYMSSSPIMYTAY